MEVNGAPDSVRASRNVPMYSVKRFTSSRARSSSAVARAISAAMADGLVKLPTVRCLGCVVKAVRG